MTQRSTTSMTSITSEISSMPVATPRSATIVIVTWNACEHLPRCLAAVASQTVLPDRLILIDNGSTDGTPSLARECVAAKPGLTGRTELIELGTNLGFAAANNLAIRGCETEFVALLNPDAFPHPDWLERLLAAAERHPEAASFGSRQMIDGQTGILDGTGDVYHASGLSWRAGTAAGLGRQISSSGKSSQPVPRRHSIAGRQSSSWAALTRTSSATSRMSISDSGSGWRDSQVSSCRRRSWTTSVRPRPAAKGANLPSITATETSSGASSKTCPGRFLSSCCLPIFSSLS